jgi:ADP-heptose:LPS heptosyltransferase
LNKIAIKCKVRPLIFNAKNGILDTAAFLKRCSLFIGIDSGAMHLAAAVNTKCIAVFGCTDPLQTGPMPLEKHVIIKEECVSQLMVYNIVEKIL